MRAVGKDARGLADQYEMLRREAIESAGLGLRGHGLALFLQRGMCAWLEALTALSAKATAAAPQRLEQRPYDQDSAVYVCVRAELSTILAGMVLACVPESVSP
jgi:hypothetical protein